MERVQSNIQRLHFLLFATQNFSRIDYFFMYSKDIGFVRTCKIGIMDLSDHSPVYLDLNLTNNKNTFTWRLNLNVLRGKMKEEIKEEILLYLSENDNGEVSPLMVWDAGKAVLRGKIMQNWLYKRGSDRKNWIN